MVLLVLLVLVACATPPAPPVSMVPPVSPAVPAPLVPVGRFTSLEPGLELGIFQAPVPSPIGDSRIHVLRVDPKRFALVLVQAAAEDGRWRTAKEWAQHEGLVAAINPGMFEPDGSLTFYGKADGVVRHGTLSGRAGALIVSDPTGPGLPRARVVYLACDGGSAVLPQYRTVVQSYRLTDCQGAPAWKRSSREWSHAVTGEDDRGRILFIQARSPWSTHDFAQILHALPLHLVRASYGEGGPEATLYVHAGQVERQWFGSYETGFREDDTNDHAWPLPNVLGVRPRG